LWWFDGAREAARKLHHEAGKSMQDFAVQIGKIDAHWLAIAALFPSERVLPVLGSNGTFWPPERIYQRMFEL
jgi:hypothetical protein